jgi:xylulokinase
MTDFFLGIDIGTYSSKGVLVDEDGRVLASHVVPHELTMPRPGWVEHDADGTWWHDFVTICRQLLAAPGVEPTQIAGVGVSTISPCVLPVDADGRPLRAGILYGIDTRATVEIAELEQALGADVLFERYGTRLSSQATAPKIRWLRKHEPEVWRATRLLLSGTGYVVYRLTGAATLDIYDAGAYAPLFDVRTCAWNPELAELVAPTDILPRVTWTCEVAGYVTPAAARQTGLAAGTPVITGTADAAAEAISAGLAAVGDMMVMYGSSIFFILKTARLHDSRRFWATRFLEPETYAVAGGMSTAGSLTRWFRDVLGQPEVAGEAAGGPNAYAALAELAASAPPGANGLLMLPYFAGERTPLHDPDARGVIAGLTLGTTRADLYRALLEAVGYGIRHNIDAMRAEGITAQRILAVGGGTQNPLWMQMVSSSAGVEQHIPRQQIGAAYGDAMLAAVGVGVFPSTAAAAKWVESERVVRPDETMRAVYEQYYPHYRALYEATASTVHALSDLQRAGHGA